MSAVPVGIGCRGPVARHYLDVVGGLAGDTEGGGTVEGADGVDEVESGGVGGASRGREESEGSEKWRK
mgnify:CR=1 FL=1